MQMAWSGVKNGRRLVLAAAHGFDALITVDKNLRYQQNEVSLPLPVLVLDARSNELATLEMLLPALDRELANLGSRRFVIVS